MKVTVKGLSAFVSTGGVEWNPDLPTMVMLHGSGLNRTVWILLARYFARRGYNVVAPDLPGHGASQGTAPSTIEEQADWVKILLEFLHKEHALPINKLVVVGHSMGTLTAIATVALLPNNVTHMVLLGTSYPMVVGDPLLDAAKNNHYDAIDMISIFGHADASRLGANRVPGMSALNMGMVLLEQAAPGVLYNDLHACHVYQGAEAAAEAIKGKARVTIVAGDQDRMTPMKGSKAVQSLFDAELIVLSHCGHMQMSEQPEKTLQAIKTAIA